MQKITHFGGIWSSISPPGPPNPNSQWSSWAKVTKNVPKIKISIFEVATIRVRWRVGGWNLHQSTQRTKLWKKGLRHFSLRGHVWQKIYDARIVKFGYSETVCYVVGSLLGWLIFWSPCLTVPYSGTSALPAPMHPSFMFINPAAVTGRVKIFIH